MNEPVLTVDALKMHFPVREGWLQRVQSHVRAVDGVSFSLRRGETLGLVGESGCGKSTLGRAILQLYRPTAGSVVLHSDRGDVDLTTLSRREMHPYRRRLQMIFQDPYASLNPRMTVADIIGEPIRVHRLAEGAAM